MALLPWLLLLSQSAQASSGAFSLRTEKRVYNLGEPVYLRIVSPAVQPPLLEEGTMTLGIREVTGNGEKEFFYHPPLRYRASSAAREGHVRFARLIANEGGLLFPKPGRYRLRLLSDAATPENPAPLVLSDSLLISVRKPVGAPDRRAYSILARNPSEYALAVYLEGGDQLAEGMRIMRELAGFRSSYTHVAALVLSSDWSQDYTDLQGGPSRPIDLEKALASAQLDHAPGSYIALRNAYRIQNAVDLLSARNPQAPGLDKARTRLRAFKASMTPDAKADFDSF
jgi:hypothetical protein